MAFMMVSTVTISVLNGTIRHLGSDIHPFEMVFFRSFFGLAFFAPWLIRQGLAPLRTRRIVLHGVRGGLQVAAMLTFFTALTITPLAKVTALQFSAPLFATVLALVAHRGAGHRLHGDPGHRPARHRRGRPGFDSGPDRGHHDGADHDID